MNVFTLKCAVIVSICIVLSSLGNIDKSKVHEGMLTNSGLNAVIPILGESLFSVV